MKYLKLFSNHTDYDEAKQNLILPNVSLCVAENDVHYNPYVDPYNGHAYVDLGLPSGTKWATMNVGASSETDYGNYYQYGKGAAQYAATSGDSDYSGTEDPLATSADTAAQVWGGEWHMPTRAQMQELRANTTYQWVANYNDSGINGNLFTAQNGNSIFLPAGGHWYNGNQNNVGFRGEYYSSSPYESDMACELSFSDVGCHAIENARNSGYSIRPVVDGDFSGSNDGGFSEGGSEGAD